MQKQVGQDYPKQTRQETGSISDFNPSTQAPLDNLQGSQEQQYQTPKKTSKRKLRTLLDRSWPSPVAGKDTVRKAIFGGNTASNKNEIQAVDVVNSTINSTCLENWDAPWQVGLMLLTSDNGVTLCGGVLVHQHWVLTAAHCLKNTTQVVAMVGSRHYYDGFLSGHGQVVAVEKSIIHEKYRPNTDSQPPVHDIALLRLSSDTVLGPDVSLARIPKRNSSPLSRDSGMVISGWGVNEKTHTTQDLLHCAQVPLVSLEACQRAYNQLGVSGIRSSHVCAGYSNGGTGPCNGDSGGGLVHQGSDGNNTVLGIISWSLGCGRHLGVYTNVQKHRPWLLKSAPELAQK